MKLDELVYENYEKLNQSDLYIWNFISENRNKCSKFTIDELALRCNVSRTTILRFAKKLSLKGYSELKVYLKWENNEEVNKNNNSLDDVRVNYHKIIDEIFDKDCKNIFDLIYNANNVYLYGTGVVQQEAVSEMKRFFLQAQEHFTEVRGKDGMDTIISFIKKEDLAIIISLSGENEEAVKFAKKLKAIGTPIISITRLSSNKLTNLADESLFLTTSIISNKIVNQYETTNMYFPMLEILFIKYIIYKEKLIYKNGE